MTVSKFMSEEGKDYTDLHNFKCITTTKNRGGGSKSVSNLVFYAQSTITVGGGDRWWFNSKPSTPSVTDIYI